MMRTVTRHDLVIPHCDICSEPLDGTSPFGVHRRCLQFELYGYDPELDRLCDLPVEQDDLDDLMEALSLEAEQVF